MLTLAARVVVAGPLEHRERLRRQRVARRRGRRRCRPRPPGDGDDDQEHGRDRRAARRRRPPSLSAIACRCRGSASSSCCSSPPGHPSTRPSRRSAPCTPAAARVPRVGRRRGAASASSAQWRASCRRPRNHQGRRSAADELHRGGVDRRPWQPPARRGGCRARRRADRATSSWSGPTACAFSRLRQLDAPARRGRRWPPSARPPRPAARCRRRAATRASGSATSDRTVSAISSDRSTSRASEVEGVGAAHVARRRRRWSRRRTPTAAGRPVAPRRTAGRSCCRWPHRGRRGDRVAPLGGAQQLEALVEPLDDLGHRQGLGPRGGELDGEGQAVEPAAEVGELVGSPSAPNSGCTAVARSAKSWTASSGAEGPDEHLRLARRPPAAPGWWRGSVRPGHPREQRHRHLGGRRRARARSCPGSTTAGRRPTRSTTRSTGDRRCSGSPAGSRHRGRRSSTRSPPGPRWRVVTGASSTNQTSSPGRSRRDRFQHEPRLAHAARADQGHEPGPRRARLRCAPARRRARRTTSAARAARRPARRGRAGPGTPAPDPGSAPPARGPAARPRDRGRAPREHVARSLVGPESVGLPAAAVQGDDALGMEPLAKRVLRHERRQAARRRRRADRSPARRRCAPRGHRAGAPRGEPPPPGRTGGRPGRGAASRDRGRSASASWSIASALVVRRQRRARPLCTSCSMRRASTASRLDLEGVARALAGRRRSRPTSRRSCETWACRALAGFPGWSSPHSSSSRRSSETGLGTARASRASSAWSLAPATGCDPASVWTATAPTRDTRTGASTGRHPTGGPSGPIGPASGSRQWPPARCWHVGHRTQLGHSAPVLHERYGPGCLPGGPDRSRRGATPRPSALRAGAGARSGPSSSPASRWS